ncbi:MoaD/ThiS family protein [candidate division KSB1 bacterium]|nr:MoaD/ThiS family protein [candidate division KSB1 bacterium]
MAQIIIPSALRAFTNQQAKLEAPGHTVGDVLNDLTRRFPELRRHLLDEHGRLRKFVNVFVGNEEIRSLQNEATPVGVSDEVSIVPSVAGG